MNLPSKEYYDNLILSYQTKDNKIYELNNELKTLYERITIIEQELNTLQNTVIIKKFNTLTNDYTDFYSYEEYLKIISYYYNKINNSNNKNKI